MITRRALTWSLLATVAPVASGCRDTEFLHYVNQPASAVYHKEKSVSDIVVPPLDILWLIDNSGSMEEEQSVISRSTATFMQNFTSVPALKWNMGLLSSDAADDPRLGFTSTTVLNYNTPNPTGVFAAAVGQLGTGGDTTERFFAPLLNNLLGRPRPASPFSQGWTNPNPGTPVAFKQANSTLAIILVTDTYDHSDITPDSFLQQLQPVAGRNNDLLIYGVFSATDFGCTYTDEDWNYAGSVYEAVINRTHGKYYKLCVDDFGPDLSKLTQDIVKRGVKPRIFLDSRPRQGTLKISYKGADIPGGPTESGGLWLYDPRINAIVFESSDSIPAGADALSIDYQVDNGFDPLTTPTIPHLGS